MGRGVLVTGYSRWTSAPGALPCCVQYPHSEQLGVEARGTAHGQAPQSAPAAAGSPSVRESGILGTRSMSGSCVGSRVGEGRHAVKACGLQRRPLTAQAAPHLFSLPSPPHPRCATTATRSPSTSSTWPRSARRAASASRSRSRWTCAGTTSCSRSPPSGPSARGRQGPHGLYRGGLGRHGLVHGAGAVCGSGGSCLCS